jgi:hypothetical protein
MTARPSVPTANDGTTAAPYLRTDFNMGNLSSLPETSKAPRGDLRAVLSGIKAAGYRGVQGGDAELPICRELGLGCTTGWRVNKPGEAAPMIAGWKKAGFEIATLHVGWGHESDAEADVLVREIIAASRAEGLPVFIETHRATITQDTWRTVKLIERNPDIRINLDFSHWYTGLEMPYGDFDEKVAFLAPVWERVRFVHARCGNSSQMQVALDHPSMAKAMEHFRQVWTLSFAGFLRSARPGDFLSFNPELLHPEINYARTFKDASGRYVEDCDRWQDALTLTAVAKECFAAARAQVGGAAAGR